MKSDAASVINTQPPCQSSSTGGVKDGQPRARPKFGSEQRITWKERLIKARDAVFDIRSSDTSFERFAHGYLGWPRSFEPAPIKVAKIFLCVTSLRPLAGNVLKVFFQMPYHVFIKSHVDRFMRYIRGKRSGERVMMGSPPSRMIAKTQPSSIAGTEPSPSSEQQVVTQSGSTAKDPLLALSPEKPAAAKAARFDSRLTDVRYRLFDDGDARSGLGSDLQDADPNVLAKLSLVSATPPVSA